MRKMISIKSLKVFSLVTFLLFFLLLGTSPAQEEKPKGPKIFVDNTSFDLAEIDEGTPITHTYIIKNDGNEDLKIEKVQPT